jgi:hypothetical protein
MERLNDLTLAEELNLDLNKIIEDKYKTTDIIKVSFIYGLKVDKFFSSNSFHDF